MFEGVPNFIRVTWPSPRPFSEFLFVHFGEIVHVHVYAKFEVCSFSRFGHQARQSDITLRMSYDKHQSIQQAEQIQQSLSQM